MFHGLGQRGVERGRDARRILVRGEIERPGLAFLVGKLWIADGVGKIGVRSFEASPRGLDVRADRGKAGLGQSGDRARGRLCLRRRGRHGAADRAGEREQRRRQRASDGVCSGAARERHGMREQSLSLVMETLGGFPNLPAMVRAEQSSSASHAFASPSRRPDEMWLMNGTG